MERNLKTIRTDVVGSLLRPAELWDARTRFDQGASSREDLTRAENEAIRKAIDLQQSVGLEVVTDGEFRRLNFQDSFGEAISGYDSGPATLDLYEKQAVGAKAMSRFEVPLDGFLRNRGCKAVLIENDVAPKKKALRHALPLGGSSRREGNARHSKFRSWAPIVFHKESIAQIPPRFIQPWRIFSRMSFASSGK